MKRISYIFCACLLAVLLFSCANVDKAQTITGLSLYSTFEDNLDYATDVVCGEFTGSEPYGNNTLYYFNVKECIYGNAPDRITVLANNMDLTVIKRADDSIQNVAEYNETDNQYEPGKSYLLVLINGNMAEAYKKILTYHVICNIFIDINDIAGAQMYGDPIGSHTKELDFSTVTKDSLIEYIKARTADNVPEGESWYGCIYSDSVADIIEGSPEVIKVRIDSTESIIRGDLHDIDEMNCTVVEVFKGDLQPGSEIIVSFFPDTVKEGDEYTVAVKVVNPGAPKPACIFTSPDSLLKEYDEEIRNIIAGVH